MQFPQKLFKRSWRLKYVNEFTFTIQLLSTFKSITHFMHVYVSLFFEPGLVENALLLELFSYILLRVFFVQNFKLIIG